MIATNTKAKVEAGIYRDMSDEEYFALPAMSKSDLCRYFYGEKAPADDRVFVVGNAFDLCVTQPWRFREDPRPVICGPDCDFRKPDDRQVWDSFVADHPSQIVLRPAEWHQVKGMMASVKANPRLRQVWEAAKPENTQVVMVWFDQEAKVWCKGKLDIVGKNLIDWKSTSYYCREEFGEAVWSFRYHLQDAMYRRGWLALTGEDKPFVFAIASKRADKGHPCWDQQLTDTQRRCGEKDLLGLLNRFRESNPDHPYCLPF